jgi:hypothetical protein
MGEGENVFILEARRRGQLSGMKGDEVVEEEKSCLKRRISSFRAGVQLAYWQARPLRVTVG